MELYRYQTSREMINALSIPQILIEPIGIALDPHVDDCVSSIAYTELWNEA